MNQVIEFFRKLTDTSDWPPRWHCGNWSDFHGWLYIIGDLSIWSAYFAIPLLIIKYISKRKDVHFHRIYFLFAAFILACGVTHFLDAVAFWYPAYRLNALMMMITGIISWVTVYYLIKILPDAFELKSSKQLEVEVEQRKKTEQELSKMNAQLLEAQKIARINNWEWDMKTNKIVVSGGFIESNLNDHIGNGLSYDLLEERVYPDDREYVKGVILKILEDKKFTEYYYRLQSPDGEIKTMLARADVVLNEQNEVVKLVGTRQDVTEQKKAEQVMLSNAQQLQALNTELQQFAYLASHDLQEPLRKIITFSSLLEKESKGVISENGAIYMQKIIGSSIRMKNLINDILNFSKLNAAHVDFEPVNLNAVVEDVLSDMEVVIEKTAASIRVDQLPEIEGHYIQLSQLFQNLISNGIKFNNKRENPQIHIWSEMVNGSALPPDFIKNIQGQYTVLNNPRYWENEYFCKIYISDNGIGFDEEYLDKLFQIFERLHNKSTYEGTGIGLAICRKIVENHHGIITAKSEPEKGATFMVTLPLSQNNFK